MPWSAEINQDDQLLRRLCYYVHWRSEQIGRVKAAEVMGVHRDTCRRYSKYNFLQGEEPSICIMALHKLLRYFGDDLDKLFFAIRNSDNFYVFQHILARTSLVADVDRDGLSDLLETTKRRVA